MALTEQVRKALQLASKQQPHSFYAYDLDGLDQHLAGLESAPAKLWYAVKANPLSAIIQSLDARGFGFDVASLGELKQVLAQGVDPSRILNTGPVKTPEHLADFIEHGVRIFVLESHQQADDLAKIAREQQIRIQVLLRVQLPWAKDPEEKMNVLGGSNPTPFGLTPEQWMPDTFTLPDEFELLGVHCFQWGNILCADTLVQTWQAAMPKLNALLDAWQIPEPVVDLGGGLGIPYAGQQQELDWQRVCQGLEQLKSEFQLGQCWMELGRYAVGPYGYYASKVADIKDNQGVHFAVIEGGSQHLLRPALTTQAFPVESLQPCDSPLTSYQIHGALCTGLDCLGSLQLPDSLQRGDWLIFSQAGAYGFTESMPYFLCHALPAELTFSQSGINVLRPSAPASHYLA
ncbi:PLP-dependent decarboxylase [Photobacterium lipolyticum]|uniref:Diaminopimelate decarboxylase n=1 Tax=Photobacterium lipolyticum TaxID=266810 RepID=A0A2T3N490_9GAMM|nr:PLP-dependent decarboxylase [Photobacterium lipolyticum]PSW07185.1 diaminopimelate decarboxylase [Photobacterium lipolyticum]